MAIKKHVRLECKECHEINYLTQKNQKTHPVKVTLKECCTRWRNVKDHSEPKKK